MTNQNDTTDTRFNALALEIQRKYITTHGTGQSVHDAARAACACLDGPTFNRVWNAALRLHVQPRGEG